MLAAAAARCTPGKNSCDRISFCWPRGLGDVGRFLSLLGSQKGNVCCLLPTVMCPIKPKRGLLSIERSTWHIWSTCWHQLLFKGSVNSSSLFYPIFHSQTQQGAFGRPWNKTARAVILFRVRLKLSLSLSSLPLLFIPSLFLYKCDQLQEHLAWIRQGHGKRLENLGLVMSSASSNTDLTSFNSTGV